ncbi:hypothetical protein C475_21989 [Halosimplex carlsbadense 2-9-1]|uniref:Uncharacterized protein n=1 Tax=Halosimplex carlsbadense 2-9-1 TaxID=797114 RepID=M0C8S0_9EURY|nr:hypothetical protein C475_21989 [Halosimplex carlsbadense 2-9-1]
MAHRTRPIQYEDQRVLFLVAQGPALTHAGIAYRKPMAGPRIVRSCREAATDALLTIQSQVHIECLSDLFSSFFDGVPFSGRDDLVTLREYREIVEIPGPTGLPTIPLSRFCFHGLVTRPFKLL